LLDERGFAPDALRRQREKTLDDDARFLGVIGGVAGRFARLNSLRGLSRAKNCRPSSR